MTLEHLLPLLRCPITGEALELRDGHLSSRTEVCRFPIWDGVPILLRDPSVVRTMPRDHVSNLLSEQAVEFLDGIRGPVLNLSAGGSPAKKPNVVEVEFAVFRNTDVVADAHELPFKDGVFHGCLCMNALEHYRQPSKVLSEIHRVLQPGAELFLHTAGLQPLHEPPHHYYNVTRYGLEEWLSGFEVLEIEVSHNFNPIYALSWLAAELGKDFAGKDTDLESFRGLQLGEVADFWLRPETRTHPKWEKFQMLSIAAQEACAAGWQARVRKPTMT